MQRKLALLALLLLVSNALTGCWSRKEITEIAIVLGAGVDLTTEGQIRLTLQIAKSACGAAGAQSGGGGTDQAASWVVSAEGRTIEEAEAHLSSRVPREIYWGHCIVLVLGRALAERGANMATDFFARDREPRETMWVLVADGEAKQVLETSSSLERTSAQAAGFLMRMGAVHSVQFHEFVEMLTSEGIQAVVPRVAVCPPGVTPGKPAGEGGEGQDHVKVSGSAAFRGDTMKGWLDEVETQGLLWLKGEMAGKLITMPGMSEPDRSMSFRVRNSHVKIVPSWNGAAPSFHVEVKLEADMIEKQCLEDVSTPDKLRKLEEAIARHVEFSISRVLHKAQRELGLDIFGFGSAFHRRFKREWRFIKERWDQEFARCTVDISVEARVREIGLIMRSPHVSK
ncbi:MAG: Ger(x)C family spore germination protein [Bacillota bacterium]